MTLLLRIALSSLLLVTSLSICYAGDPNLSQENAKEIAIAKVQEYARLAKLFDEQGNDLSELYLSLFSMNAKVALDIVDGKSTDLVSPQQFVAEAYSRNLTSPLPVTITIKSGQVKAQNRGENIGFIVEVPIRKQLNQVLGDRGLNKQEAPLVLMQVLSVIVDANGNATINRIVPLIKLVPMDRFTLDLGFDQGITQPQYEDPQSYGIQNFDKLAFSTQAQHAVLRYHLKPFSNSNSGLQNATLSFGLGVERYSYQLDEEVINGYVPDYLGANDRVTKHLDVDTRENLNNLGGNDIIWDGVLAYTSSSVSSISPAVSVAVSLPLAYSEKKQTYIELGVNVVGGSTQDVEVTGTLSDCARYNSDYFENNDIVFCEDHIEYRGQNTLTTAHAQPYQLIGTNYGSTTYKLELATSINANVRLLQMFTLGLYSLGGYVELRQQISSPVKNGSGDFSSSYQAIKAGVPRLVAFTERVTPLYLGFGVRIQKR